MRQYIIIPGILGSQCSGRSYLDGEKFFKNFCFELSIFILIIKLRQKINNIPYSDS